VNEYFFYRLIYFVLTDKEPLSGLLLCVSSCFVIVYVSIGSKAFDFDIFRAFRRLTFLIPAIDF